MPKQDRSLIYYNCNFVSLPLQKDTGINLVWMSLLFRSKSNMDITQHGPANPAIQHPRDCEAEQRRSRGPCDVWAGRVWRQPCLSQESLPGKDTGDTNWKS